jgi:hypothetical protein
VADLSREAVGTPEEPAAGDDPTADPGTDPDEQGILASP